MKFTNIEEEISKILWQVDIWNLISGGAPDDEYDFEVPKILKILNESAKEEIFLNSLYSFYLKIQSPLVVGEKNQYIEVSKKIFNLKK